MSSNLTNQNLAPISVRPEMTPNPATMKFMFSQRLGDKTQEFNNPQDADVSPLAQKLFGFPWTSSVFVAPEFVTVTKQDWVDWDVLKEPLTGLISEHFAGGEALWLDVTPTNEEDSDDPPQIRAYKEALNREIRPVVALDGGDVIFAKFEDNILFLQMKGACAGCPSSSATLKQGIEVRMKELFPEIQEVRAI